VYGQILQRFSPMEEPGKASEVASLSALLPDAVTDRSLPVRLAEKAVAAEPGNPDFLDSLGAVLYRAGRAQEAARRLRASAAHPERQAPEAWLFLAMAYQSLGRRDEARRWRDRAARWIDGAARAPLPGSGAGEPLSWDRRLGLQLLRREAEAMLAREPRARK
jgi:tetratricopeptide (TPR) repeat protein